MDDLYEIGLRGNHRVNRLVSRRSFIDHIPVLAAFHTFRDPHVIVKRRLASLRDIARPAP
jgi:hypothetical protein